MKKNTKIIIIAVVAIVLTALVVWYFGFFRKKTKEQKEESKEQKEESEENLSVVNRTDYGKAPAASFRLNQDLNKKFVEKTGIIHNGEMVNTNKIKR